MITIRLVIGVILLFIEDQLVIITIIEDNIIFNLIYSVIIKILLESKLIYPKSKSFFIFRASWLEHLR
jgi:hypothetical protein